MHDPSTVAFDIKYPWWKHRPWPKAKRYPEPGADNHYAWNRLTDAEKVGRDPMWRHGYRTTFITIWHVDPEKDGSDDSCGWSYPRLTPKQRERLHNTAWSEGRNPYFMRCPAKEWKGTRYEAECLYRGIVLLVADVLGIPLTFDEAARHAARTVHHADCIDPAGALCYLPGYHDNFPNVDHSDPPLKDGASRFRQERFAGIIDGIAVTLLRARRPWWRHPKWHFWHWRLQIHPWQEFRRWAFDRCSKCGGGFAWGETCVSGQWDRNPPKAFRSSENIYHMDCSRAQIQAAQVLAA